MPILDVPGGVSAFMAVMVYPDAACPGLREEACVITMRFCSFIPSGRALQKLAMEAASMEDGLRIERILERKGVDIGRN